MDGTGECYFILWPRGACRYCNIDYIISSAIKILWPLVLLPLLLSYDIICQWVKNLLERFNDDDFPARLRVPIPTADVQYVIPKYHFNGHKEDNHSRYSLNFKRGVGRTDGEEIERNWFRHNSTATSTREMGPGSRHDTLDDHFGWNNHLKMIKLGKLIVAGISMLSDGSTRCVSGSQARASVGKSRQAQGALPAVQHIIEGGDGKAMAQGGG